MKPPDACHGLAPGPWRHFGDPPDAGDKIIVFKLNSNQIIRTAVTEIRFTATSGTVPSKVVLENGFLSIGDLWMPDTLPEVS